jgi:hypothetical protein
LEVGNRRPVEVWPDGTIARFLERCVAGSRAIAQRYGGGAL